MTLSKIFLGMALAASASLPAFSQTKPAASTTKVKKVLHYYKIGGWRHEDGIRDMTAVMNLLAKQKGFTVVHAEDETVLNLANLKTFSAIVWDNNVNGGGSVAAPAARQAVLDYVSQGGGWLLVHGAGDHQNNWAGLLDVLGTTFSTHGAQGAGEVTFDAEAKAHKELKFLVQDLPPVAKITKDEWYAFQSTVRGKPGVTVVAIAGNGPTNVILPYADDTKVTKPENRTYIWAKEVGTGRTLYTAVGHGGNQLYAQADSFAVKATWENLRYVAGDYKYGCTNKSAPNYDSTARVDNASCTGVGIGPGSNGHSISELNVAFSSFKNQRVTMAFAHAGKFSLEMRDASGSLVWKASELEKSSLEINRPLRSGIYYLKAVNGKTTASQKVILL